MDKTRKKLIKRYISWGCLAILVAVLAFMPVIAAENAGEDGPVATVKSASAAYGTIENRLEGGGVLAEEDAQELTLPAEVKLTEFLVENGDAVQEGDALAQVDKVSVMTAISQIQETLDYLDEQIQEADNQSGSDKIKAQTAGRVKIIYAQPGDQVQDVILEHGALAVLSLDGRMAVDIQAESNLMVGNSVLVALESGEEVTGRVDSTLGDNLIITIDDEGYDVDAPVRVSTTDGEYLGDGKLYIHNPWNATAYYGTVSNISVKENQTVYAGQTLLTLEDAEQSPQYAILVQQRREYEDLMQKLFQMYLSGVLTAPCDGVVSGVDEESEFLLAAEEGGWTIQLLANDPYSTNEDYTDTIVWIQSIDESGMWTVKSSQVTGDFDYKNLGLSYDTASMTDGGTMGPVSVYTQVDDPESEEEGETIWQETTTSAQVGDILLVAQGSYSFALRLGYEAITPTEPDPTNPPDPTDPSDPTNPSDPTSPTLPSGDGSGSIQFPGGMDISGMGGLGGLGGSSAITPSFEPYDLTEYTVLSVIPQDTMELDITVDELDISKISLGQSAQITVNALSGQVFSGTVTKIGAAENSGGNSKFTVSITMERGEDMLAGMSACASLSFGSLENVLTIPAAALQEDGEQIYVYTGYDESNDLLLNPTPVTIGASDGESVQILSGLEEDDICYYTYYDAQKTE